MKDKLRLTWPGMMFGGVLFALLAASEFVARANIAVNGVVISSELDCVEPAHNRCVRTYTLKSLESGLLFTYAAGPNDHSLPQSIPNGATVIKRKGELSYTIDGRTVTGFPIWFYTGVIIVGCSMFVSGLVMGFRWFGAFRRRLADPEDELAGS